MELEPAPGNFRPIIDRRKRIEEPLPSRLIAVADVRLLTPTENRENLDGFYVDMLGMIRVPGPRLIYRTDNFRIHFDERPLPIEYPDLKPLGIEVRDLWDAEHQLVAAGIEYTRQRHVSVGLESLLLRDPGGNWVELVESRSIG